MSKRTSAKNLDNFSERVPTKQRPKRRSQNRTDYDQVRPKVGKYDEADIKPRRKSKPNTDRKKAPPLKEEIKLLGVSEFVKKNLFKIRG